MSSTATDVDVDRDIEEGILDGTCGKIDYAVYLLRLKHSNLIMTLIQSAYQSSLSSRPRGAWL